MRVAPYLLAIGLALTAEVRAEEPPTAYYPPAALAHGIGGQATVDCVVGEQGAVSCHVASETPTGQGFGQAVVDMSRTWRARAHTQAGASTAGGHIRTTWQFSPGPPPLVRDVTDGAAPLDSVRWTARPSAADFERYYPTRARNHYVSGRTVLACVVMQDQSLTCEVRSEDPPGYGFGDAAIQISHSFRMAPQTTDGRPTVGGRLLVPITFRLG